MRRFTRDQSPGNLDAAATAWLVACGELGERVSVPESAAADGGDRRAPVDPNSEKPNSAALRGNWPLGK